MKNNTTRKYFIVLLLLSFIKSLITFYTSFWGEKTKLDLSLTGDDKADILLRDLRIVVDRQFNFSTNIYNKIFASIAILLLIASIVFLVKKIWKRSVLSYILYIVVNILKSLYSYFHTIQISDLYSSMDQRVATTRMANFSLTTSILFNLVILFIIFYNLRSKVISEK